MAEIVTETLPPLQHLPTAKEKKYDRQLRLWGATGQIALEESHILLVNNGSGVAGIETLKNLVLPGLGQFSILDPKVVTAADLGVNFFLEETSLNKFRAQETVRLLEELNPSVKGHAITEPIETFLTQESALSRFNIIIVAAPIDANLLNHVQTQASSLGIPLFYVHCVGFYSKFTVSLPSAFPIVETHPDPSTISDLRLLSPWPALVEFASEKTRHMDTPQMNPHEKAHIPWICLILYYLERWKSLNNGELPTAYKQKSEFRQLVREGDPLEENFDEACANVLKALNPPAVPSAVREILNAPEAQELRPTSPSFWLIANAVQQFCTAHGALPVPGAVPDLKAQSADYIRLQNIYKQKARDDYREVLATVRSLEAATKRDPSNAVDEKEVENFCKGAAYIHLVRGRPAIAAQTTFPINFGDRAKAMAGEVTNPESLIGLYIAFLAWDAFVATHTTSPDEIGGQGLSIPGSHGKDLDHNTTKLIGIAHQLVDDLIQQAGTFVENPEYDDFKEQLSMICTELVRAGGGEMHNIASVTGGLLSQEIIKIVTRQYIPVDNTCLFDGIVSRTYVLRA